MTGHRCPKLQGNENPATVKTYRGNGIGNGVALNSLMLTGVSYKVGGVRYFSSILLHALVEEAI
jgi:hypothetical protein